MKIQIETGPDWLVIENLEFDQDAEDNYGGNWYKAAFDLDSDELNETEMAAKQAKILWFIREQLFGYFNNYSKAEVYIDVKPGHDYLGEEKSNEA